MTTNEYVLFLQFLYDKFVGGYFSPEEIETVTNRAQYERQAQIIAFPEQYGPEGEAPGFAYDRTRRIKELLLPFRAESDITLNSVGRGTFPDDYVYMDSLSYRYFKNNPANPCEPLDEHSVFTYRGIDYITEKEWADRTGSTIDTPTVDFPMCRFLSKNTLEVSPYNIRRIKMIYIRKPLPFYWGRTIVNGEYVYDPADPLNQPLEWYELDQNAIVIKALSYVGINLRENDLLAFAQMKEGKGV